MTAAPILDERITNSQLIAAGTCLRKHSIAYVHGIRPATNAVPLRFGIAWHDLLHRRAKGMLLDTNLEMLRGAYDIARTGNEERDAVMAYECVTLATMFNLYDWRWGNMDSTITVTASEEAFAVPIINPDTGRASRTFIFAGKIDRRIALEDGRAAVMENKTTSDDIQPDSDYWKRLRVDTQIARYVLAARSQGHAIDTVLYDVTKKPGMRPGSVPLVDGEGVKIVLGPDGTRVRTKDGKKYRETADKELGYVLQSRPERPDEWGARLHKDIAENVDKYFARREIPRTDMDLAEARRDLWDAAQVLHACDKENRWPRNSSACIGFGRCQYLDLCSENWTPGESDVIPEGFVRVDDTHQELIN
jgi:hypothetical protein